MIYLTALKPHVGVIMHSQGVKPQRIVWRRDRTIFFSPSGVFWIGSPYRQKFHGVHKKYSIDLLFERHYGPSQSDFAHERGDMKEIACEVLYKRADIGFQSRGRLDFPVGLVLTRKTEGKKFHVQGHKNFLHPSLATGKLGGSMMASGRRGIMDAWNNFEHAIFVGWLAVCAKYPEIPNSLMG